ncbi:flagellar basal body L-ring protein FlgH [Undibacterium sp.]|jgi:flagellar L-ring protein precursor FlgH|uniref:flagellar basal body L-ring protein FlgH n=1 Tax=Undibacterium sp. TaxID=1914977 RepID=UPI002BF85CF7|nr:flagellar basal body L-ring protein FlgH [Undibacterium sp.]HTD04148.1 flagellar basal body L-ring protein FlgH [Undibacterium sp.]
MKSVLLSLTALLLSACAAPSQPPVKPGPSDDPPPAVQAMQRKGQSGGVFVQDSSWSLTSDSRAFRTGDVVTVMLEETTQASKKADTSFDKSGNVAVKPLIVGGKTLKTDIGAGIQRDFGGTSSSTQQNTLQGAITVIVQEVLPNGLLRVTGEKSLYLNQGEEFVRLRGYVRSADIDADNRVSSQRIANARIAYSGTGALADANSPGWLTRFFVGPWMPF